jgi:hypothetical protein
VGKEKQLHIIAIDWSGAASGARRKIWLAEYRDCHVTRLECGRSRDEIADHLIELAQGDSELVVGLDFAFSLPAWFLDERRLTAASELWALASEDAERWLRGCEPPFWGRPGRQRPRMPAEYRLTDRAVPSMNGILPKSVFQVGGPGAVGTGSLRGMPFLHRLKNAGFTIWPFDDRSGPTIIEIYPRVLTGSIVKSNGEARASRIRERYPTITDETATKASSSDDAFDALVSALVMGTHASELRNLRRTTNDCVRKEGWIWCRESPLPA